MSFEYLLFLSFSCRGLYIIVLFCSVSFVYVWEEGRRGARMEKDQDILVSWEPERCAWVLVPQRMAIPHLWVPGSLHIDPEKALPGTEV